MKRQWSRSSGDSPRARTRRYSDAGFPQIKIYSSLKPELVVTIAREAHRRGMSLTGHIPEGMDLRGAVEAGMDQINHITYVTRNIRDRGPEGSSKRSDSVAFARMAREIDPETDRARQMIRFLKEHGTVIDPTLAIYELSLGARGRLPEPGLAKVAPELSGPLHSMGVPPDQERDAEALFQKYLRVVGALHKAGVPIVAGTDQSVPGHSLHRELELYTRAGMTPMEAIRSATIVPARAMKRDRQSGTIEAGKRADLVLVAGRPDRNISDIRRVKIVIAAGRAFDCAELWKSIGFQP